MKKLSKLNAADYREATNRLINDENHVKFFKSYGISVETLRTLMVGLSENKDVIMPIYNHLNKVLGTLYIYNIFVNGGIYKFDTYGFCGNPKNKDTRNSSITIAKNIIDVLLLWQVGVDNPVIISDRVNTPYLHTYKEVVFVDDDDELVESCMSEIYTYGIKDLVNYLSMYKELPKKKRITEADIDSIEYFRLPAIIDGEVCVVTDKRRNVLGTAGHYTASINARAGLYKTKRDEKIVLIKGDKIPVPRKYKPAKKSPDLKELYEDLFEAVYGGLPFMSEDQCRLVTLFIMYMWTISWKLPLKTHLHIINASPMQISVSLRILQNLCPNPWSHFDAPTIYTRSADFKLFYYYSNIILDDCASVNNYDLGAKILVTTESSSLRSHKAKIPSAKKIADLRVRLLDAMFNAFNKPVDSLEFGLYYYFAPFHQMGEVLGIDPQEIKRLFNVVCMSAQKVFRYINLDQYRRTHTTRLDQDSIDYFGETPQHELGEGCTLEPQKK